jgi:putative CocE/NonD family hydrolase
MADDGYIFVFQDIRGRYQSEGKFVMVRPPRDQSDAKAIDESTDTHDTIEWLLKNVPKNNGRVGMLGISYGGWLTVMGLLDPHPALKAVSPQASPADMFLGDDFHHNGAFRLSYGFEYVAMMETSKTNFSFKFDRKDTFDWYLRLGALSNANAKHFQSKLPTWNDFVAHPNYDEFWKKQTFGPYIKAVTVPTLNVAGWWDQEDYYGPLKIYELLEKHDRKNQNFLVIGPWNHGGWSFGEGNSLGKIPFDIPTGAYYRSKIQAPFFAQYLKDQGKHDLPEALLFETGSNKWVRHAEWPPNRDSTERKLYFQADGKLSFEPPPAGVLAGHDSYISDPAHPVPYRQRPIDPTYQGSGWYTWQTEDQRFVHQRPDVLSYETEPLAEDLTIAGDIVAHLYAATSGTDADWIVKLIDVYPEDYPKAPHLGGYQLMVACEVFRGRFRNSFEKPEPIEQDEINHYKVGLHWRDHCFPKGHKIMVQVQSTWFPVIDRNPQKYVPNIFEAKDSDYQKAMQRVYRTRKHASHVSLPVMGKPGRGVESGR